MTICPCCGFKSTAPQRGSFQCTACGAEAVGEPLPRPENELPSFGRSLLLAVIGALSVVVFLTDTVLSLIARSPISFGFWSWVAAGETAAWHLKWTMIPLTALVFFSRNLYRSVKDAPARFCALRYARRGYFASATVPLLVLMLIGVTVPERLRHHRDGIEAAGNTPWRRVDLALDEYRAKFKTLPSDIKDLRKLPDQDGSLTVALNSIESSEFTVNSDELAAAPTKKPRSLRGAVILNASVATPGDEPLSGGITFTNYELRLPGPDKIQNTDDDVIIRDGVRYAVSDLPRRPTSIVKTTQR